ncbi:MAG: hypothetical protein GX121_03505 [Ignavibacteria bacterium]|nr:hypothetical protein [Ignavibacteria bacterium]
MRINYRQQQLIEELYNKVKSKYTQIKFKDLEVSPDDPEHIWINVISTLDEDEEIEMMGYSAELGTELLEEYGYRISIMPENPNTVFA